jgi:metal-responsive CopG/Arc/MetJ family transcriptional regulator
MKVKTSITLSEEALAAIDRIAGGKGRRSQMIETAVVEFVARRDRLARDARERAIIEANADALNEEARDVLEYQADL